MKIELMQVIYTVVMVIFAFLGAIVVTKTLSKWLKLDVEEKEEREEK